MFKTPLYSKMTDYTRFPSFYKKAKDCYIWSNGKKYLDMAYMGIGCNILGYADNYVNHHVKKCINNGNMSSLSSNMDAKFSALLLGIHQWADTVRFARTGGEALWISMKLAIDFKKRHKIAPVIHTYGYNGWILKTEKHINKDFIVQVEFDSLNACASETVKKMRPDIIIFDLTRHEHPTPEAIDILKKWQSQGTILICDEVTTGFRFTCGGLHLLYGLKPDICVFAKGMSNGYPMAAIIGKRDVMESDLWISSTYWSESIGPTAAYYTIKKLKHCDYRLLVKLGQRMFDIWRLCAEKHGIKIKCGSVPQLANFDFDYENRLELKTIFIDVMKEYGILATDQFYPSFSHKAEHMARYIKACDIAFYWVKKCVDGEYIIPEDMIINEVKK